MTANLPPWGEMSGRTEGGAQDRRPIGPFHLDRQRHRPRHRPALRQHASATSSSPSPQTPSPSAPPKSASPQAAPCSSSANRRPPANPSRHTAAALGFVTSPTDPRTRIAACPGTPACASGHIATRDIAETIAAENADILDFTLHISGCAKGCAHPGPAALTMVGGENGAGLVVNATAKALPAGYRPGYDAARGISRVAATIRSARYQGETAAACLTRLGRGGNRRGLPTKNGNEHGRLRLHPRRQRDLRALLRHHPRRGRPVALFRSRGRCRHPHDPCLRPGRSRQAFCFLQRFRRRRAHGACAPARRSSATPRWSRMASPAPACRPATR